ncbi:hypothetical protein ACLI4R_10505 [Natrialbaceae archaeon A-chndr2]
MGSERRNSHADTVPRATVSRRSLLAASGVIAVGGLAGCLNRVASSVTNTGASPAAVFAGVGGGGGAGKVSLELAPESPHVARLTPTLAERVELEGWVTSSAVMAQNHNSSRSHKHNLRGDSGDSDGDGVDDGSEEDEELVAYLGGNPIVAERFTVCLPDAEVPGGNGSIREAVTPERLFAYLAGQAGEGNVYAWGRSKVASDNSGDCDDTDDTRLPGAVCGSSPHFVADVSEPVATGGGLVAERGSDGRVTVMNTPPSTERGAPVLVCPAEGEPFEPEGLDAWGQRADGPPLTMTHQGRLLNLTVAQVMVQPPGCPEPVPALMYVGRGLSDGQLVYSGGWLINDAALYEDSATVLTMDGSAQVVGIECCFDFSADAGGDGFGDMVARAGLSERALRGAQIETGTVSALVKTGTLSEDGDGKVYCWGSNDYSKENSGSCGETGGDGGEVMVTHCPLDAPILHLVNAGSASSDVKFKTGAELSKSVN